MRLPKVLVRRLRSSELRQAARLLCANRLFMRYGMTEASALKMLRRALADRSRSEIWAAVRGSELLGFAWVQPKAGFDRSAYLRLIAVAPAAQGFGVGSDLMQLLEKRYLRPGGFFILASRRNRGARRFYERLGYKRVATLRDYVRVGMDEFLYFKAAAS